MRGTLKGWAKFWCVVKPGMLLIYKSAKVLTNILQMIFVTEEVCLFSLQVVYFFASSSSALVVYLGK